jgi:hypothetical protein
MVLLEGEWNVIATTKTSACGLSTQQQQVDKIIQEHEDVFSSYIGVPVHYQVKHSIDLSPGAPLPNVHVYRRSVMENEEIKRQI